MDTMNESRTILSESSWNKYGSRWNKLYLMLRIIWAKILREFVRPPFPELDDGSMNLHLGCGPINHPQFINIDIAPLPHIHYVRSIDDLSPFKDNTVNLIYACHCLEHFSHRKLSMVLSEWFRVLKKGGILRLSVPDFDLLLTVYYENGKDMNIIVPPLMGGQDYKYNFHKSLFNEASLKAILSEVGFSDIKEWHPGSSELTTFDDCSAIIMTVNGKAYALSLNLEAIK